MTSKVYLSIIDNKVQVSSVHPDNLNDNDYEKFSCVVKPIAGTTAQYCLHHLRTVLEQSKINVEVVDG